MKENRSGRSSLVATEAFLNLKGEWRLGKGEAASLLGASSSAIGRQKRGARREVSQV